MQLLEQRKRARASEAQHTSFARRKQDGRERERERDNLGVPSLLPLPCVLCLACIQAQAQKVHLFPLFPPFFQLFVPLRIALRVSKQCAQVHKVEKRGEKGEKGAKIRDKKIRRHLIEERIVLWRKCVKLCASENASDPQTVNRGQSAVWHALWFCYRGSVSCMASVSCIGSVSALVLLQRFSQLYGMRFREGCRPSNCHASTERKKGGTGVKNV